MTPWLVKWVSNTLEVRDFVNDWGKKHALRECFNIHINIDLAIVVKTNTSLLQCIFQIAVFKKKKQQQIFPSQWSCDCANTGRLCIVHLWVSLFLFLEKYLRFRIFKNACFSADSGEQQRAGVCGVESIHLLGGISQPAPFVCLDDSPPSRDGQEDLAARQTIPPLHDWAHRSFRHEAHAPPIQAEQKPLLRQLQGRVTVSAGLLLERLQPS